jgi:hypothetical protein
LLYHGPRDWGGLDKIIVEQPLTCYILLSGEYENCASSISSNKSPNGISTSDENVVNFSNDIAVYESDENDMEEVEILTDDDMEEDATTNQTDSVTSPTNVKVIF